MAKTYQLEVAVDELDDILEGGSARVQQRLRDLAMKARADREAADLRLPWRVHNGNSIACGVDGKEYFFRAPSCRAANIMAAGPELLEAVQAAVLWSDRFPDTEDGDGDREWMRDVEPPIQRALRKVASGVPE
jgi:hypothetical protein